MTTTTITTRQQNAIADLLATMPELATGMGTRERAGSIAAINLALTGRLADDVPECMSEVVGNWIVRIQDTAPADLCRDHPEWRRLLPLAAGTGRENEIERADILIDWMWDRLGDPAVLATVPEGAGDAWGAMVDARCSVAADLALVAVMTVYEVGVAQAAVVSAAMAAAPAAEHGVSGGIASAIDAASYATRAAAFGGMATSSSALVGSAAHSGYWRRADLPGTLRRLINL